MNVYINPFHASMSYQPDTNITVQPPDIQISRNKTLHCLLPSPLPTLQTQSQSTSSTLSSTPTARMCHSRPRGQTCYKRAPCHRRNCTARYATPAQVTPEQSTAYGVVAQEEAGPFVDPPAYRDAIHQEKSFQSKEKGGMLASLMQ